MKLDKDRLLKAPRRLKKRTTNHTIGVRIAQPALKW